MDTVYYVGIIAQFLSYASFLSGAKVCHHIYCEKSSARLSPMPFLAGFNCMALWLRYGFLADEYEIISVNFIGLTCQIIYLAFFVCYSKQKSRILKQWLVLMIFLSFIFWLIEQSEDRIFVGGSFASLAGLIACASPLATIQDVLKTKCVSSMPFPIIISTFVVTLTWLLFGLLRGDNFIVFSNSISVIISGAQLSLFLIYPSKHAYEKLSPSNKKSYDLIKLLNSDEDNLGDVSGGEIMYSSDDHYLDAEIDTNQDYKETLAKIMSQIYSKRQLEMSRNSGKVLLLCAF